MGGSDMQLVILAGGFGTRIAEESDTIPKPLVTIGGKPIIWHIMNIYAAHGIRDFIVCAGYRGEMLKEYFANFALHTSDIEVDFNSGTITSLTRQSIDWRVRVIDTGSATLTGGRLKRVAPYLAPGETFCMTYGDGVADIDITAEIAFHRAHGLQATMAAVVPPARFGALRLDGDRVTAFVEKPVGGEGLINGGFFVLEPAVLDLIEGDRTTWEDSPLETLAAQGQLAAYRHHGFWHPMDTLRDRRDLEKRWSEGAPWKVW